MLLSAEDMVAIGAIERGRVGGIVATLRDAAEGVLEARTALRSLVGWPWRWKGLEGHW